MNRTRGNFHLPTETLFPSVQLFGVIFCTTLYPLLMNVICLKQPLKYIHRGVWFIIDQSTLTQTQFINSQQQTHAQVQKFLSQGGGGGVLKNLFLPTTFFTEGRTDLTQEAIGPKGCPYQYFYFHFFDFPGAGARTTCLPVDQPMKLLC